MGNENDFSGTVRYAYCHTYHRSTFITTFIKIAKIPTEHIPKPLLSLLTRSGRSAGPPEAGRARQRVLLALLQQLGHVHEDVVVETLSLPQLGRFARARKGRGAFDARGQRSVVGGVVEGGGDVVLERRGDYRGGGALENIWRIIKSGFMSWSMFSVLFETMCPL